MKFTIVAVGKLKESFWREACAEYLKRLKPYAQVEVREIPDVDPARAGGVASAREKEGAAILAALAGKASSQGKVCAAGKGSASGRQSAPEKALVQSIASRTHVILLDIGGKERTSVEFSQRLDELGLQGKSDITFVIGGSDGVSEGVRACASETLSFGRITLPHNLARVVLLEQLYRAMKISHGEPYHK